MHVSLILDPKSTGEPKTKPMQNSIRNLRASGLIPDLLVCRSEKPLSDSLRVKIANFAIVEPEQVVLYYILLVIFHSAFDLYTSIYCAQSVAKVI